MILTYFGFISFILKYTQLAIIKQILNFASYNIITYKTKQKTTLLED